LRHAIIYIASCKRLFDACLKSAALHVKPSELYFLPGTESEHNKQGWHDHETCFWDFTCSPILQPSWECILFILTKHVFHATLYLCMQMHMYN